MVRESGVGVMRRGDGVVKRGAGGGVVRSHSGELCEEGWGSGVRRGEEG